MAFDGAFLHKVVEELNEACDTHVDKIYQPSKDELVFLLRKKGFVKRLYITLKQGSARIHFTENRYENPQTPPNFCMLLRKYLSSARLLSVSQPSLERVVILNFSATNEMGDIVPLMLVCELIGGKTNVILVSDNGKIIDSLKHSDIETAERLILPSAKYLLPPSQNKKSPLEHDLDSLIPKENSAISNTLLNSICGFSPLICREAEHLALNSDIKTALSKIISDLKDGSKPFMLLNTDGSPLDYSYTEITQYGDNYSLQRFDSFSELLDAFYTQKDTIQRISFAAHDITKLITNLISRTEKRLALRLTELENCKNRENLRIYGELIKANLHAITNGSKSATVQNYYDSELKEITIPLNPALTPAKNADKYFKDYKKSYTAEQTLIELTRLDREELVYFDSVLDAISRSVTLFEISEIRQELTEAGYIKKTASKKVTKKVSFDIKQEISKEGYKILIGKNNVQNDYITTHLASKGDMWFHTKNIPGSHVVVFSNGEDISEETVLKAATLAAANSKAAHGEKVPVDYTLIKYVKKPSGSKPGMVIYTTNKTVFVTP